MHRVMFKKPDRETLKFLVEAAETICAYEDLFLQGSFYVELLQALVLEGHSDLALRLIALKSESKVNYYYIDTM